MKIRKIYIITVAVAALLLSVFWGISEYYGDTPIPVISYADSSSVVTAVVYSPVIVDINTANIGELETLTGIGRATAEKIVAYRNENGGFKSAEQLLEIDGIGESKLSDIIDKISISGIRPEFSASVTEEYTGSKINLNTADKDTLMTLDGIGEVIAERIIAYAESTGFDDVGDLLEVEGIGEAKFKKIEPYVTAD